jgi:hypothetical protein
MRARRARILVRVEDIRSARVVDTTFRLRLKKDALDSPMMAAGLIWRTTSHGEESEKRRYRTYVEKQERDSKARTTLALESSRGRDAACLGASSFFRAAIPLIRPLARSSPPAHATSLHAQEAHSLVVQYRRVSPKRNRENLFGKMMRKTIRTYFYRIHVEITVPRVFREDILNGNPVL